MLMLISAINPFFFGDGEMVQSVSALAIHCQEISVARVVGSNPIGGAFKVDFSSPQHPRVYTSSVYSSSD